MAGNNDVIRIDRAAANADMRNLSQAMKDLENSRHTISQLISCAEGMSGQTGTAIRDKAEEMKNKIDKLYNNLSVSRDLIDKVIIKYQSTDIDLAEVIKS